MLEDILKVLGSEQPMNSRGILTRSGWTAYSKLIKIVYMLAQMGVVTSEACDNIIARLDRISDDENIY